MNRVKKMIHTDHAYKSGLSGKNITVAVMDTGYRVIIMSGQQNHGKIKDSRWFSPTKKCQGKRYF